MGVGFVGKYAAAVCRNVQVALPSASESGGQSAGLCTTAASVDPAAFAAFEMEGSFEAGVSLAEVGFQLRNAVQVLHGLPSGPRTIPGGSLDGVSLVACDIEGT